MRRWAFLMLLSGLAAWSDGPLFEDPGPTGLVIDISAASSVVASVDVVSIRVDGPVTRSRTAAPARIFPTGRNGPLRWLRRAPTGTKAPPCWPRPSRPRRRRAGCRR